MDYSSESKPANPAKAVGSLPKSTPARSTGNARFMRSASGSLTAPDGRPVLAAMSVGAVIEPKNPGGGGQASSSDSFLGLPCGRKDGLPRIFSAQ